VKLVRVEAVTPTFQKNTFRRGCLEIHLTGDALFHPWNRSRRKKNILSDLRDLRRASGFHLAGSESGLIENPALARRLARSRLPEGFHIEVLLGCSPAASETRITSSLAVDREGKDQ
jgi:hypothetical protein